MSDWDKLNWTYGITETLSSYGYEPVAWMPLPQPPEPYQTVDKANEIICPIHGCEREWIEVYGDMSELFKYGGYWFCQQCHVEEEEPQS